MYYGDIIILITDHKLVYINVRRYIEHCVGPSHLFNIVTGILHLCPSWKWMSIHQYIMKPCCDKGVNFVSPMALFNMKVKQCTWREPGVKVEAGEIVYSVLTIVRETVNYKAQWHPNYRAYSFTSFKGPPIKCAPSMKNPVIKVPKFIVDSIKWNLY